MLGSEVLLCRLPDSFAARRLARFSAANAGVGPVDAYLFSQYAPYVREEVEVYAVDRIAVDPPLRAIDAVWALANARQDLFSDANVQPFLRIAASSEYVRADAHYDFVFV